MSYSRKLLKILCFLLFFLKVYALKEFYFQEVKSEINKNKKDEHFIVFIREDNEAYNGYEVIRKKNRKKEIIYMSPVIEKNVKNHKEEKTIYDKFLEKEWKYDSKNRIKEEIIKSYGVNLNNNIYIMMNPSKKIRRLYTYNDFGYLVNVQEEKIYERITDDQKEKGYSEEEISLLTALGYEDLLEINKETNEGIDLVYDMEDNIYIKTKKDSGEF